MTILPESIILNNTQALSAFNEGGNLINRSPLNLIEQYAINKVDANQAYSWDFEKIGHNLRPLTLFGYDNANVIDNNDDLIITISDVNNQSVIWELKLKGKKNLLGNAFFFEFPMTVISTSRVVTIVSEVNLSSLIIFGEKIVLNEPPYIGVPI